MNTKTLALLTLLIPLQAVAVQTTLPTTENTSPTLSPSTSFKSNSELYPTFTTQKSIFKNPHFLTQFTIGAAANVFSHSNVQAKLSANKVGLACGLAAHLFLNSRYGTALINYITKDTDTDANINKHKDFLLSDLGTSCLGYGAGASAGALARFGYDTAAQWWVAKTAEHNRLTVEEILGKNCPASLASMYCGDKTSMSQLLNIDTRKLTPHISKDAWDSYIKKYFLDHNISFEIEGSNTSYIVLKRSSMDSWINCIIKNLEKDTHPVAKSELIGVISNETLAKLQHNKKYVDEAIRQLLGAVLVIL